LTAPTLTYIAFLRSSKQNVQLADVITTAQDSSNRIMLIINSMPSALANATWRSATNGDEKAHGANMTIEQSSLWHLVFDDFRHRGTQAHEEILSELLLLGTLGVLLAIFLRNEVVESRRCQDNEKGSQKVLTATVRTSASIKPASPAARRTCVASVSNGVLAKESSLLPTRRPPAAESTAARRNTCKTQQ
jgi:hypothetical protein